MIICIDTSKNIGTMSLFDKNHNLILEYKNNEKITNDIFLIESFQKISTKINSLKYIFVVIGPGSYTGIRMSVAFAHGLNLGHDTKICGISKFDACIKKYNIKDFKNNVLALTTHSRFIFIYLDKNKFILSTENDIVKLIKKNSKITVYHNCNFISQEILKHKKICKVLISTTDFVKCIPNPCISLDAFC